jgi:quercetin dioxygenase-like cupin family protein
MDKRKVRRTGGRGTGGSSRGGFAGSDDFLTDSSHAGRVETGQRETESLGDRVRKAREMRSVSLADLSAQTGIRVETLQSVESNELIPPLGELVKLGKALETRMGYFISPGTEKAMTVVRAGQRQPVARHRGKKAERYGYSYESLAPEKANRVMEPFILTLLPSADEKPSTHDGQEFIFVLDGQVKVRVADRSEVLGPGDALYYDSKEPHFVGCAGEEAKILAVLYPGAD